MSSAIRTPDQRLRVFVSSTLRELAEERDAARAAIQQIRLTPVMFDLGARAHPPRELYRAYLAQSDVFVGIYWQRYGFVAPHMEISGLEDEYALAGDKPRLLYVKRSAEREPRLAELLERIERHDRASYRVFDDKETLAEVIQNDLAVLLSERFSSMTAVPEGAGALAEAAPLYAPPVERGRLIGRGRELEDLVHLLGSDDVGLITVTGPGGTGKTRLAVHVAHALKEQLEDGCFYVSLAAVRDPAEVMATVMATLELQLPRTGGDPERLVAGHLRTRKALLVLDNFEQVLAAGPSLTALLAQCPRLKILVTSQHALRVRGEHELALPPLAPTTTSGALAPAVELFEQRAREHRADFRLTDDNRPAVVEICRRLDGLPLAVELAAARVRVLTPQAILQRLDKSLALLTGGAKDLPERQRTLRGALTWSHELLSDEERVLYRRLGVLPGAFSFEAAEATAGDVGGDVLDGLQGLVDKSLLTRLDVQGETWFAMLSTVREHALEKLAEAGEEREARARNAAWAHDHLVELTARITGRERGLLIDRFHLEEAALRAALAFCMHGGGDKDLGWRIYKMIAFAFCGTARMSDVLRLFKACEPAGVADDEGARAGALLMKGWALSTIGDHAVEGARLLDEVTPVLERLGRTQDLAWALVMRARSLLTTDVEEAYRGVGRARELFAAAGDRYGECFTRTVEAFLHLIFGRLDEARAAIQAVIELTTREGDDEGLSLAISVLGRVELAAGDLAAARGRFAEAVAFSRDKHTYWGRGDALANLGATLLALGDDEEARAVLEEAALLVARSGPGGGVELPLGALAALLFRRGERERAARALAGVPDGVEDGDGILLALADPLGSMRAALAEARAALGDEARALRGVGSSLDDAVRAALGR